MKRKIVWLVGTCLVIMSLILVSCGEEEEEEEVIVPETKEEVTVPETKEEVTVPEEKEEVIIPTGVVPWWKKDPIAVPEYGGTFTYRTAGDPAVWDPYWGTSLECPLPYEGLAMLGWMVIDPEITDFKIKYAAISGFAPCLAETWEVVDWSNFIFHIRKGAHFHDKPPVNAREVTAADVEYSYNRLLGLGSGFTEPSPYTSTRNYNLIESVTATDKYTVVFKLSESSMSQFHQILDEHSDRIVPREAVELWGDMNDWDHAIGTGPFILKDYVAGSSITAVRNPNYWCYDEHYPENQLPYLDTLKGLIIPDNSTAYAALRTGKVDFVTGVGWEQTDRLQQDNPELVSFTTPGPAQCIAMHIDVKPFDDFRVRRAMQMSIDRETIVKTIYGGYVPATPVGQICFAQYRADYEDWPQEVKDGYAYNPEGAKQLLAEAGYPDGFKCTMAIAGDTDLWEIIQAYFAEIGIDMELEVYEATTLRSMTMAGKCVMSPATWGCWEIVPPVAAINHRTSKHYVSTGQTHINDPFIDDIHARMSASLDDEEQMALVREADMYIISQQWTVNLFPRVSFTFHQPWVKRYPQITSGIEIGERVSRVWIDQDLKKALGR